MKMYIRVIIIALSTVTEHQHVCVGRVGVSVRWCHALACLIVKNLGCNQKSRDEETVAG